MKLSLRGRFSPTIRFAFCISLAGAVLGNILSAVSATSQEDRRTQGLDEWEQAGRDMKRLPPSAFTAIPPAIVQQLNARGCSIPQTYGSSKPHNVIRGEFAKKGQIDWTVLCSRKGRSSLLVFWGGEAKCASELASGEDRHWLQEIGEAKIGYSRAITTVNKKFILDHYSWYGGPKPPPLDHHGINDAFIEKASVVRYCYEGKWLELTGSD